MNVVAASEQMHTRLHNATTSVFREHCTIPTRHDVVSANVKVCCVHHIYVSTEERESVVGKEIAPNHAPSVFEHYVGGRGRNMQMPRFILSLGNQEVRFDRHVMSTASKTRRALRVLH